MKILFLTRGISSRGGHIVVTNIVRGLRKKGYDIELTTFESEENIKIKEKNVCWDNLDVNIINVEHSIDHNKNQIIHIEAASKYIKENINKFDRVILDSWPIALAVVRTGILSPKMFQLIQSSPNFIPANKSEFWKAELSNLLPFVSPKGIVVSKALAECLKKKYDKKFDIMPLFLDKVYLDAQFNVRNKKVLKIVSSSSTFNIKTKGLNFLLQKLKKIQTFKFELTLITGVPIKEDLNKFLFPIKIKSARSANEMVEELCRHDVYVNTSTKEAFCLALAEAIAIGMPSVTLDSVGNREYMDGKNAIFVKEQENFIVELEKMQNFNFRKKLSKNAKKSMQKYTLENTLINFKKIVGI